MEITRDELTNIISNAIQQAARQMNLDNGIAESGDSPKMEDNAMASTYRETYTFTDNTGAVKHVRLNGTNKRDTDMQFQAMCSALTSSPEPQPDMSLSEFIDKDYRQSYISCLAETTQTKYEYYLKRYILPEIGDKQLSSITVKDIQSFRLKMAEAKRHGFKKNLSAKSIDDMTGFLNKIFKVAVAMGRMRENPVKRELLKKVGEPIKHHNPLSPTVLDRCKKAIPYIESERVRLYAAILFFNGGGMRPEEILGLRWENIDFDEGLADVDTVVTYAGRNKHPVVKAPKTENSRRIVLFPKALIDVLSPFRNNTGYIVHGRSKDEPISYSGWQRTYREMQKILDLKGKHCSYDLRATCATQLIEQGCTATMASKLLGHADSRMVETVYARTRREGILQQRAMIEGLNKSYS